MSVGQAATPPTLSEPGVSLGGHIPAGAVVPGPSEGTQEQHPGRAAGRDRQPAATLRGSWAEWLAAAWSGAAVVVVVGESPGTMSGVGIHSAGSAGGAEVVVVSGGLVVVVPGFFLAVVVVALTVVVVVARAVVSVVAGLSLLAEAGGCVVGVEAGAVVVVERGRVVVVVGGGGGGGCRCRGGGGVGRRRRRGGGRFGGRRGGRWGRHLDRSPPCPSRPRWYLQK